MSVRRKAMEPHTVLREERHQMRNKTKDIAKLIVGSYQRMQFFT